MLFTCRKTKPLAARATFVRFQVDAAQQDVDILRVPHCGLVDS